MRLLLSLPRRLRCPRRCQQTQAKAQTAESSASEQAGQASTSQAPGGDYFEFQPPPPETDESRATLENVFDPAKARFSRQATAKRRPYAPFAPSLSFEQMLDEEYERRAQITGPKEEPSPEVLTMPDGLSWQPQAYTLSELPGLYASLIKARLTGLVVLSGVAGFALAPAPFAVGALAATTAGTAALSASANSLNQFLEVPYDSQMQRTLGRPLVRGKLSPLHALGVASVCGVGGFLGLYHLVNPLTAWLGAANLALYVGVYTPMKRLSIGCTWAGAVVGAMPPLMGWSGALGADLGLASIAELGLPALTLAGILYAWQFPHFNSLSWNLRGDYSRAGYRVMCVLSPDLCLRTTLRYSLALLGLCSFAAPASGLTTWLFAADSLIFNLPLIWLSWKFYQAPDSKNSRQLFRFSLAYLPGIVVLMIISKPSWKRKEKKSSDSASASQP